jgi:hypothetical protein
MDWRPKMGDDLEPGWGMLDDQESDNTLSWLRVSAGTSTSVLLLSAKPLPYIGHWHAGIKEFVRCSGAICRHCLDRLGRQPRWVFGVQDDVGKIWAWECGKIQARLIKDELGLDRELRGSTLMILRPRGGGHPPTLVSIADAGMECADLPACPDLALLMRQQWQRQALRLGKGQAVGQPGLFNSEKIPASSPGRSQLRAEVERVYGVTKP